jgi:hypothetical protein
VPYLVDCNVTSGGSNTGTSSVPCFPLKLLWEHFLRLCQLLKQLVGPGDQCEGAQVVYQEDNTGPHTVYAYTQWMRDEFLKLGWRLELQAPQGIPEYFVPYTNTRHYKYLPVPTILDRSLYKRTGFVFVSVHVPPAFRPTTLQQY